MTASASVWRSKCPYNIADPEDLDPCPHCDADNPVPAPSVGHVCVGPPSSRKPRLCRICSQFLPHDCVGSAQPVADRLDGFALLSDAQVIHGPPLEVEVETNFAAAELRGCDRRCQAICSCSEYAGRKWPIGTPDETVYGSAYSTADEWHLRLRAARINCGLTLDALARRLDPPRTRKDISAMEHGRRGLSVELCAQLADALDCDRLWLAGWTLEGAL